MSDRYTSPWLLALLAMLLVTACPRMTPAAEGLPTVRLTLPQMNADSGAGSALALAAAATSPDGAIVKVEFFDDNQLVGAVTQAPFTLTYHPAARKLNFCLTARATDAAGQTAVSAPVTCVAPRKIQRRYQSYDYEETAEDLLKQVRLTIPEGLTTVRGLLVVSNAAGDDSRDRYRQAWYGEFLWLYDFAFLGTKEFNGRPASFAVMQRALQQIAQGAAHPELVNVPYAATGFSNGGGFAARLLAFAPGRVIGCVPCCSALMRRGDTPDVAAMQTPTCVISGGLETNLVSLLEPVLAAYRPQGALFAWMTVQGAGHAPVGQEVLAMPLLEAAVRLRYPPDADVRAGPVALKSLDPAGGWVADNTTWKSGLTSIAPAAQFIGDLGKSSWLLNEDLAFIYRAYATYDKPLTITSPVTKSDRAWDPGCNVTILVDDGGFPQWKKLEFYDGAHKLGEITQGAPQFTALDLAAGCHAFSVLGTDAQGRVRPSNPVLVVVRKLPTVGESKP